MAEGSESGGLPGFSKGVHDYYAHYVDNADAKIGALVGVNLAVAGLLLARVPAQCAAAAITWLAIAGHAGALGVLGFGIYPRLDGGGIGTLFWEQVRRYPSAKDYVADVDALSPSAAERVYAENNYVVAGVLRRKFRAIRIALWITAGALLLAAGSVPFR